MRFPFIFILVLVFISTLSIADTPQIVRFDLTDSMKIFLKKNHLDITGVNYDTMEIEAYLTDAELDLIRSEKAIIKFSFPATLQAAPDEDYKNPSEIEDFLQKTHATYPDITTIKSIGKTLEGRDILAIKISDNSKTDEKEPVFFVNGMHHAREVMTPEITTDMIDYLTKNYEKNSEVKRWVDQNEIWVIPMFNLDGNVKMWNEDKMWRKNTRGGFGVDINRNYPEGWNSCEGSSDDSSDQDYRGEAPGSEPETQAMMKFVEEIKPVFSISYHSYSELVVYPFGCRPKRTPSEEAVETIGKELGNKLKYKAGTVWELLYNADGGDIDWLYAKHQVIPYVIEVNSTWAGFHPNYKLWRNKTVERNRPGWMHLLNKLNGPSLQGVVNFNDYSQIQISKSGNSEVIQTYKINSDGTYFVILNPGNYDVVFTGGKSKKFSSVEVQGVKSFVF